MGEFELFTNRNGSWTHANNYGMCATVAQDSIRLGMLVYRNVLDEPQHVRYHIDQEDGRVAIEPADEDADGVIYSAKSAEIAATSLYSTMGVEVEESHRVEVDTDHDGLVVIDVSEFIDEGRMIKHPGWDTGHQDSPTESDPSDGDAGEDEASDDHSGRDGSEADEDGSTNDSHDTAGLDVLTSIKGVGQGKVDAVRDDGFETLREVAEADPEEIAQDGALGLAFARKMSELARDTVDDPDLGRDTEDDSQVSEDSEEPFDRERVQKSLEFAGVPVGVGVGKFVRAIDARNTTFEVAQAFDRVARGDVAEVVRRLDIQDALEASDNRLAERMGLESLEDEGGASA